MNYLNIQKKAGFICPVTAPFSNVTVEALEEPIIRFVVPDTVSIVFVSILLML